MTNFSNLISKIKSEMQHQVNESSLGKCLKRHKAANIKNRKATRNFFKQSHSLKKSLTLSKAEKRLKNQKQMQHVRQKLKAAILSKSILGVNAIKVENSANTLQAKLYQRGLI